MLSFRGAALDEHAPAFHIAQLPQALDKFLGESIGRLRTLHVSEGYVGVNNPDPGNLRCGLRCHKQRRGRTRSNESDKGQASCHRVSLLGGNPPDYAGTSPWI